MKKYILFSIQSIVIAICCLFVSNVFAQDRYITISQGKSLSDYLSIKDAGDISGLYISGYFDPSKDCETIKKSLPNGLWVLDLSGIFVNAKNKYFVIPDKAFYNYIIENLKLPKTVDSIKIGESAFEGNYGLLKVSCPYRISFIGKKAFKDCVRLDFRGETDYTGLDLRIEDGAFAGCKRVYVNRGTDNGIYVCQQNIDTLPEKSVLEFHQNDGKCRLLYCSPYYTKDVKLCEYTDSYALYRCTKINEIVIGGYDNTYIPDSLYHIGKPTAMDGAGEVNWDSCKAKVRYSQHVKYPISMCGHNYNVGKYGELYDDKTLIYLPSGLILFKSKEGTHFNNKVDFFDKIDCSKVDSFTISTAERVNYTGVVCLKNFTYMESLTVNGTDGVLPQLINCPNLRYIYYFNMSSEPNYFSWDLNSSIITDSLKGYAKQITVYVKDTIQQHYLLKMDVFKTFKAVVPLYGPGGILNVKDDVEINDKVNSYIVYPTIATNIITVKTSVLTNVICCNSYGKIIETTKVIGEKTIDVSSWPKGIYFINNIKVVVK